MRRVGIVRTTGDGGGDGDGDVCVSTTMLALLVLLSFAGRSGDVFAVLVPGHQHTGTGATCKEIRTARSELTKAE